MELSSFKIKKPLIFWEINFLALILRNFLYFLKRKLFLFFRKRNFLKFQDTETPKKIFIFQETELFYISGNGTFLYFRKRLIFQEVTFQAQKMKKTHS